MITRAMKNLTGEFIQTRQLLHLFPTKATELPIHPTISRLPRIYVAIQVVSQGKGARALFDYIKILVEDQHVGFQNALPDSLRPTGDIKLRIRGRQTRNWDEVQIVDSLLVVTNISCVIVKPHWLSSSCRIYPISLWLLSSSLFLSAFAMHQTSSLFLVLWPRTCSHWRADSTRLVDWCSQRVRISN